MTAMKREEELTTSDDNLAYNIGLEIRYAIAASGVDPIQHIPEVDGIIKRRIAEIRTLTNSPKPEPVGWETDAEWDLEMRCCNITEATPFAEVSKLINDLWQQYCLAAEPKPEATEGVDRQVHHSTPVVSQNTQIVEDKATEVQAAERSCTCHPDDNPPIPCARKFAYSECVTEGGAHEKGLTAEQLCRTPLIEWLVPTTEEWNACEVMQDRYDLMKKLVRRAFKAEQYASESRAALTAKQTDGRKGE